ncbi:MAG TPA: hypothetical protein VHQ20_02870 [Patescibacteria group bacterium]|jgi:hypothetical protein|nr:hypothetical protein [Patescibacteria group bacterium]
MHAEDIKVKVNRLMQRKPKAECFSGFGGTDAEGNTQINFRIKFRIEIKFDPREKYAIYMHDLVNDFLRAVQLSPLDKPSIEVSQETFMTKHGEEPISLTSFLEQGLVLNKVII